jgi:hypothetical protein
MSACVRAMCDLVAPCPFDRNASTVSRQALNNSQRATRRAQIEWQEVIKSGIAWM